MARGSLIALLIGASTVASSALAQSRGALLYSTHCISCHTAQMHWRDNQVARDWSSLKAQVQRWQAAASLAWGDDDIEEVARYLNENVYRFEPTPRSGSSPGR